ncbi:FG-GAP-like repeat-containing protein [Fulvivirgaceae bacterium BMA12]|uniref:FG-GAP-like repeat-containing protein n=1 Tax=Agaribacillus aureus TaxID=3051825 RepID=A0ABT8KYM9_9BACT|nr:FG-GAP-like repeat-containing protein [Fulvivirgaceae bacterium BMA12]
MRKISIHFLFAILSFNALSQTWEEVAKLAPPTRVSNDKFGWSVSLSEKYGIIGTIGDDENSEEESEMPDAGSAYIIARSQLDNWEIIQKITASDRAPGDKFGNSVSIFGEWAVVGAPNHHCDYCEPTGMLAGAVYVFHKNALGEWEETQVLTPTSHGGFREFGNSVAIHRDVIVVGAYKEHNGEIFNGGAAYVFKLNQNNIWEQVQKLQSTNPTHMAFFGNSVDVNNNNIIVGAPNTEDTSSGTSTFGVVYYYVKNDAGEVWDEEKRILPEPGTEGFGYSLSLSDRVMVIGVNYGNPQKAFVYEIENSDWILKKTLVSDIDNGDFAESVSASDNFIVVGDKKGGGYLYCYEKGTSGDWTRTFKIYPPDDDGYSEFGSAISVFEDNVLIGSALKDFYDEYNRHDVGEAYIFRATDIPYAFEETNWFNAIEVAVTFSELIDFDNDGDLDLFLSYYRENENVRESQIFENKNQNFVPTGITFPHLTSEDFASWVNVNGDEFLDLLLSYQEHHDPKHKIYLNMGDKNFREDTIEFTIFENYWQGGFHFADFDNDTDQDILVQGYSGNSPYSIKILENDGNFNFQDSGLKFDGWIKGSEPWCDFNADGLIDFVASEEVTCDNYELIIYKNNGDKTFEKIKTSLIGLNQDVRNYAGDLRWGDFDNDGDYDIVLAGESDGCTSVRGYSNLYVNNGNESFDASNQNFGDFISSVNLRTGDFNNDGQLDLFSYGKTDTSGSKTELLINKNGNLTLYPIRELIDPSQNGSMNAGDIDGDSDLDMLIAGNKNYATSQVAFFKNNSAQGWANSNQPPEVPSGLKSFVNGSNVTLSWDQSNDDHTPTIALTYNIRVYRNDTLVVESYSNLDGSRKIPQIGNVHNNLLKEFKELKSGFYKWSVQAIDQSFAGSQFADEEIFIVGENALDSNNEDKSDLVIFPNPTSGPIILFGPLDNIESFHIKDIRGTQIFAGTYQNRYMSLEGLKDGIYILTLIGKEFIEVRKIIKE